MAKKRKAERVKLALYLDADLALWLRRRRAEERASVSAIAARLLRRAIAAEGGPPRASRAAG